jgi:hypothetical protein
VEGSAGARPAPARALVRGCDLRKEEAKEQAPLPPPSPSRASCLEAGGWGF